MSKKVVFPAMSEEGRPIEIDLAENSITVLVFGDEKTEGDVEHILGIIQSVMGDEAVYHKDLTGGILDNAQLRQLWRVEGLPHTVIFKTTKNERIPITLISASGVAPDEIMMDVAQKALKVDIDEVYQKMKEQYEQQKEARGESGVNA